MLSNCVVVRLDSVDVLFMSQAASDCVWFESATQYCGCFINVAGCSVFASESQGCYYLADVVLSQGLLDGDLCCRQIDF